MMRAKHWRGIWLRTHVLVGLGESVGGHCVIDVNYPWDDWIRKGGRDEGGDMRI